MPKLKDLMATLGWEFNDPKLLSLALTHPSASLEPGNSARSNQRLEFLGDAVLQLVLTQELYLRFPRHDEGPMTKARARLVNRAFLNSLAQQLELGRYLHLSRGEELQGGRERPSALADALEAVIGAMFLDAGFDRVRELLLSHYGPELDELDELPAIVNPKGELQELLQTRSPEPPRYHLDSASGPEHNREFECVVTFQGQEIARGRGKTKKAAEGEAAVAALEKLRQEWASPVPETE